MRVLARIITIVAFCAATVGAAGLRTTPEGLAPERGALPLVIGGVIGLLVGGVALRSTARRRGADTDGDRSGLDRIRASLAEVLDEVRSLDEGKSATSREELLRHLDALSAGPLFDLTSRHEELVALVGFSSYASVWEGIATGERLLARAWSIATDRDLEEAIESLPPALAAFQSASSALERL